METQADMMKSMNQASHIALAKMMQEAKILMADMSGMDPSARAWHGMYHERISKRVLTAQASAASVSMAESAGMAATTQSVVKELSVAVELPAIDGPNVMEVQALFI
jgi:hypothetical protein